MFVVVAYDIVDDARRLRTSQVLANFGDRVQKSVFECDLDERQLARLQAAVARIVGADEDSVRYYRLCGACRGKVEALPPASRPAGPVIV